jgi:hypothetical protein
MLVVMGAFRGWLRDAPIGPTGLDLAQLGAAVRCSPDTAELAEGTPALFAGSAADAWVSVQSGGQGEWSPAAIPSGQGVRDRVERPGRQSVAHMGLIHTPWIYALVVLESLEFTR